ncbi:hypothetical protein VCO01S_17920 [Vibrio comitans NBRC 102076]|uniref:Uncharacterized protein n=1 Tax=Vibrio comitans NBRC 102076 TaxID=1219078 RepID=A0A4Y3IM65_9VIBR|nr:hypothetical protein VCO01S_17920 [Vibrio comitans NBRC 102076]
MTTSNKSYIKRTQRDYTLGFKLQMETYVYRGGMFKKHHQASMLSSDVIEFNGLVY